MLFGHMTGHNSFDRSANINYNLGLDSHMTKARRGLCLWLCLVCLFDIDKKKRLTIST